MHILKRKPPREPRHLILKGILDIKDTLENMATQEEIDQLTSELNEAAAAIKQEIAELDEKVAAGEPINLDKLKEAVSGITAIEPPKAEEQPAP